MSSIPPRIHYNPLDRVEDVVALIPDFPFDYGTYLNNPAQGRRPLGTLVPDDARKKVLVVGAGVAGTVAAYELMRIGFHPVVVEASDRIGGRMYARNLGINSIGEMGCMRFPVSGKALFHYFDKVGMSANSGPFPNPGSEAAVSTVVDYQGRQQYYEYESERFPIPPEYVDMEREFFEVFLEQDPIRFTEMVDAMTVGSVDQKLIKQIWNEIVRPSGPERDSWDNLSFHAAMVEQAKWSPELINLFGQVGFGTGGWNTDYPNSFLEVLRVLYTSLDINHRLMYDGTSELPRKLFETPPADFGDECPYWPPTFSVKNLTGADFQDPTRKEVRFIVRNEATDSFDVMIYDAVSGESKLHNYWAVVYTPHVRILDKFRHRASALQYNAATASLPQDLWEAIMYTHYMQSTKLFAATTDPFWTKRDAQGKRLMSVTLSDRLTRGTYPVDYGPSTGPRKGSGIFLSYTWNDDSLKFLGAGETPDVHAQLCTTLLSSIYPDIRFNDEFAPAAPFGQQTWEDQRLYLGAFKMNLPGQYEYQKRIFSQFMDGLPGGAPAPKPDRFVLAGDDVSWVGGWAEGAVTTALNAVDKMVEVLGGSRITTSPIMSWDELRPV